MNFPIILYSCFSLLVMPDMDIEELKITTYTCAYLATVNKHWGYLSKTMLVDGLHPINEYGVMTNGGNGTGLTPEQVESGIEKVRLRRFFLIEEFEDDPDKVKVKINLKYLNSLAFDYVQKHI